MPSNTDKINTDLIYLQNNNSLSGQAKIVDIVNDDGKVGLILNQTLFYPQGGGQSYDKGVIKNADGKFIVDEVRFFDGVVKHYGSFVNGVFKIGDAVDISIDPTRRILNSRIHSAGHLIDFALNNLEYKWKPGKGYHFPDGPYVEYQDSVEDIDTEKLKTILENECNKIIVQGLLITFQFTTLDEAKKLCQSVPENIPNDKPLRIVVFDKWASPCGGTHVSNLKEIEGIVIRKIKIRNDVIRISYLVK